MSKAWIHHTKVGTFVCVCRWVSKDGIGAVGRLFIGLTISYNFLKKHVIWMCKVIVIYLISGGRFGNLFDNDPKQWRLYADFIGSTGRFESYNLNRIHVFSVVGVCCDEKVMFLLQHLWSQHPTISCSFLAIGIAGKSC